MIKWCLPFVLTIGIYSVALANNVKIDGEAKVIQIQNDTATVEFKISWDNSWRDDFNWDAVWIFLKYKKRGNTAEWHHAYLCREGHTVAPVTGDEGGNYTFMLGEVGSTPVEKVTGVYLMREGISEGRVNTKIQIKWPVKSNPKQLLDATDFGIDRDSIYLAAYALEMVYVPYGSYALGDEFSTNTFNYAPKDIPAAENIIEKTGNVYAASSVYPGNYAPENALPGKGASIWCSANQNVEDWWRVDFGSPRVIRHFAVANVYGTVIYGYLEGSNTAAASDWKILWSGGSNCWPTINTYPIPQRLKVTDPGAYRYYRLRMKTETWNGIRYVSMSDRDNDDEHSFITVGSENGQDVGGLTTLPLAYPKGYRGYYMMKYEVSQEQYVEFLNSLTMGQQKNRVANNNFSGMVSGDYVFGDLKRPNNRNGIAFISLSADAKIAMFGNNLNPDNEFFSEDDGQTLACNYLSPADMLAYCDWSGLRPMSELEYEKACRRPYPQIPEKGEFAWNENTGVTPITKLLDLTGEKTERETPFDYRMNVNVGGKLNGPVRNGAFATSKSNQRDAGATYWGVMEMSGNLWEMCYNATSAGAVFKGDDVNYSHGDGYIAEAGTDITTAYWPVSATAFAVRGGSYAGADILMRTSDRTFAAGTYFSSLIQRDSTVGFRGVRSILNTSGFGAGTISCQNGLKTDTVCSVSNYIITGEPAENTVGKTVYSWYKSEDNGLSWAVVKGEMGVAMSYDVIQNKTTALMTVKFKRKATCAVGEEETDPVTLLISPVVPVPVVASSMTAGLGYDFVLPAPPVAELTCKWEFPDGSVNVGEDLTISDYTIANDGIYKVFYVNKYGCESVRKEVYVLGANVIKIVDYGNYKGWADGSFAHSAKEYRNPSIPYVYEGETGDGIYRIDPDGSGSAAPVDAYCDMTTDGGGWTLVWKAASNNSNTYTYTYDVGSLAAWNFNEVGMAYINLSTMVRSNFTIMSGAQLITDFKAKHPFTYPNRDISITARYGSYQQANVTFRYGYYTFGSLISDAWNSGNYGRVGIVWSQLTPYYNAFYSSVGDYCSLGNQAYSTTACSDARRMSFWIR